MREPTLRELLNRVRWAPGPGEAGVELVVRSRQAGRSLDECVSFASVVAIGPRGLDLMDGTFIPYHRVLVVSAPSGPLWQCRERRQRNGT